MFFMAIVLNQLFLTSTLEISLHKLFEWRTRHSTQPQKTYKLWPFSDFFHLIKEVTFFVVFNKDIDDNQELASDMSFKTGLNKTLTLKSKIVAKNEETVTENTTQNDVDFIKFNITDAKIIK